MIADKGWNDVLVSSPSTMRVFELSSRVRGLLCRRRGGLPQESMEKGQGFGCLAWMGVAGPRSRP